MSKLRSLCLVQVNSPSHPSFPNPHLTFPSTPYSHRPSPQNLDISEEVLVELLQELQATWSIGCGKPQVMVDEADKTFIFVL